MSHTQIIHQKIRFIIDIWFGCISISFFLHFLHLQFLHIFTFTLFTFSVLFSVPFIIMLEASDTAPPQQNHSRENLPQ